MYTSLCTWCYITFTCGCWFILVHKLIHNTHTYIHTYTIDGMGHKSFLIFVEVYLNELVMFQNKSCNKYVYQTCLVLVVYVHVFDTLNF